jgi:hypothetical protein
MCAGQELYNCSLRYALLTWRTSKVHMHFGISSREREREREKALNI